MHSAFFLHQNNRRRHPSRMARLLWRWFVLLSATNQKQPPAYLFLSNKLLLYCPWLVLLLCCLARLTFSIISVIPFWCSSFCNSIFAPASPLMHPGSWFFTFAKYSLYVLNSSVVRLFFTMSRMLRFSALV